MIRPSFSALYFHHRTTSDDGTCSQKYRLSSASQTQHTPIPWASSMILMVAHKHTSHHTWVIIFRTFPQLYLKSLWRCRKRSKSVSIRRKRLNFWISRTALVVNTRVAALDSIKHIDNFPHTSSPRAHLLETAHSRTENVSETLFTETHVSFEPK
jgi:hypothetical protein